MLVLGVIWLVFASISDVKTTIVANWISFSLIIFVLGFRVFYSLFTGDFNFLLKGLIGFGIFFVLGNLFYYTRIFAGGDAKIMYSLGPILALSGSLLTNLKIFLAFFIIYLFSGVVYGIIWSAVLMFRNFGSFREKTKETFNRIKIWNYFIMFFGILLMLLGFFKSFSFYFGVIIFILPYLYIYSKAVDESCMVKLIKPNKLVEGDWLYQGVKIGRKTIKSRWGGLTKEQIELLKKRKKLVKIRYGIPFVPVFLIAYILLIIFLKIEIFGLL